MLNIVRCLWSGLGLSHSMGGLFTAYTACRTMTTMIPRSKVELHVHLDGAIRPETAFELAVKRSLPLPAENVATLKHYIHTRSQGNLVKFLQAFTYFLPSVVGDTEAIERMAYEFCEDAATEGVIYAEARYSPHYLSNSVHHEFSNNPGGHVTPTIAVEAVNEGLRRGQEDFGIKVRSILACIRNVPEWSREVLQLVQQYSDCGVVGIDLAGDERFANPTHQEHVEVFKEAKRLGINRTVHAGENGSAANVMEAIEKLHAQRLGHGYHAMDISATYERCLKDRLHFELCPYSSFATGSVKGEPSSHPLVKLISDGASVSISTDDPAVTGRTLTDEYELVRDGMLLTWQQMTSMNIYAAKASFLPDDEKEALVKCLCEDYEKQAAEGEQVTFGLD